MTSTSSANRKIGDEEARSILLVHVETKHKCLYCCVEITSKVVKSKASYDRQNCGLRFHVYGKRLGDDAGCKQKHGRPL